jgi:hypothetical protein
MKRKSNQFMHSGTKQQLTYYSQKHEGNWLTRQQTVSLNGKVTWHFKSAMQGMEMYTELLHV